MESLPLAAQDPPTHHGVRRVAVWLIVVVATTLVVFGIGWFATYQPLAIHDFLDPDMHAASRNVQYRRGAAFEMNLFVVNDGPLVVHGVTFSETNDYWHLESTRMLETDAYGETRSHAVRTLDVPAHGHRHVRLRYRFKNCPGLSGVIVTTTALRTRYSVLTKTQTAFLKLDPPREIHGAGGACP